MKRIVIRAFLAVLVASFALSLERTPFRAAQLNISGYWSFRVPRADGTFQETYFDLKQDGDTVSGRQGQRDINEGTFKAGVLHLVVTIPAPGGQGNPTRLT